MIKDSKSSHRLYDGPPQGARGNGSARSHSRRERISTVTAFITALILLAIGIVAIPSMVFHVDPFS